VNRRLAGSISAMTVAIALASMTPVSRQWASLESAAHAGWAA